MTFTGIKTLMVQRSGRSQNRTTNLFYNLEHIKAKHLTGVVCAGVDVARVPNAVADIVLHQ